MVNVADAKDVFNLNTALTGKDFQSGYTPIPLGCRVQSDLQASGFTASATPTFL